MKKLLCAVLFTLPLLAQTYVSQSGGSLTCAGGTRSTVAVGSVSWAAGTTYVLCGVITSAFTIGASGTSGTKITVMWDTGARVSVAFGQIISLNGNSWIVFDGGTPCGPTTSCYVTESANPTGYPAGITGIIEATANGSGLAHQDNQTQAFYNGAGSHDIEVKNLIIRNLYQHTSLSDVTNGADTGNFGLQCPFTTGCASGNISIHDSDIHDVGLVLSVQRGSGTTISFYNNEVWRTNWLGENSGNGTRTLLIHDNHIHDTVNWDTTSDAFHHNGLHNYMNVSSDSLGLQFYNNLSDGDWGHCCTTATGIFTETAHPANFVVYNNVVVQHCGDTAPEFDYGGITSAQGGSYYNNTMIGCASTGGNVAPIRLSGTNILYKNNAIQNYGQYVVLNTGSTFSSGDYNSYGSIGLSGNSPWQCGTTPYNTFSTWQSGCSADSHGQKVSDIMVNSTTGMILSGSPLIGAAVNLTSLGIGPLNSDKAGVARPSTGPWDTGAFQFGSAPASFSGIGLFGPVTVGGPTTKH